MGVAGSIFALIGVASVIGGGIIRRRTKGSASAWRSISVLAIVWGIVCVFYAGVTIYTEWQDSTPAGQLAIARERAAAEATRALRSQMDNVRYVTVDQSLKAGQATIGLPIRPNAYAYAEIIKTSTGWQAGCKDAANRFVPFEKHLELWQAFVQGGQCPPGYVESAKS